MATAACRAGRLSCCFPRCPQCQEKPIIRNAIRYIYLSLSPPASSSRLPSRPCAAPPPLTQWAHVPVTDDCDHLPKPKSPPLPFRALTVCNTNHSSGPCWGTLTRGSGIRLAGAGLSRLHLWTKEILHFLSASTVPFCPQPYTSGRPGLRTPSLGRYPVTEQTLTLAPFSSVGQERLWLNLEILKSLSEKLVS